MKQGARLFVFAVLVLALAVVGVGGATVALNYNASLESSASVLNKGYQKLAGSGGTLTSALLFAEDAEPSIAVSLVAFDHSVSVLRETDVVFSDSYSVSLLKSAVAHAVVVEGSVPYQLRAYHTANDEYVLLATSLEEVRGALDRNLLILVIASITAIALGGAMVFWLARRNMRTMLKAMENTAEHERETRLAMQNFMGDASHELRTPLTVIKGYSELLAKGGQVDSRRAYERIVEQVNRMDETIGGLLELAEVGSVSANSFALVNLSELVEGAADDLKAISPSREIEVSVAPVSIQGSKQLLAKLLSNATGNIARHAGQKAAVKISLSSGKNSAVLIIEDGGKGLPDSAYSSGVQAFKRFDASRSRETGGTGLGMSIMNSIVEAHSGTMELSKSKLGGLRLEFHLPLN